MTRPAAPQPLISTALFTANSKFAGPSGSAAVAGRIEPVKITGFATFPVAFPEASQTTFPVTFFLAPSTSLRMTLLAAFSATFSAAFGARPPSVKLKKNAVSSIVSVPCIITKPSTFSCDVPNPSDANSLILRASKIQISEVISSELILQTCSTRIFATFFNSGTASINVCASSAPDLYPISLPCSPAPAMVPPVAKITIFFIAVSIVQSTTTLIKSIPTNL